MPAACAADEYFSPCNIANEEPPKSLARLATEPSSAVLALPAIQDVADVVGMVHHHHVSHRPRKPIDVTVAVSQLPQVSEGIRPVVAHHANERPPTWAGRARRIDPPPRLQPIPPTTDRVPSNPECIRVAVIEYPRVAPAPEPSSQWRTTDQITRVSPAVNAARSGEWAPRRQSRSAGNGIESD